MYKLCQGTLSFLAHLAVSAVLLFNIFFNYSIAVWCSPGKVDDFYDTHQQPPAQGSLNDFTFCYKCAFNLLSTLN
jgi:hypothetical protein